VIQSGEACSIGEEAGSRSAQSGTWKCSRTRSTKRASGVVPRLLAVSSRDRTFGKEPQDRKPGGRRVAEGEVARREAEEVGLGFAVGEAEGVAVVSKSPGGGGGAAKTLASNILSRPW